MEIVVRGRVEIVRWICFQSYGDPLVRWKAINRDPIPSAARRKLATWASVLGTRAPSSHSSSAALTDLLHPPVTTSRHHRHIHTAHWRSRSLEAVNSTGRLFFQCTTAYHRSFVCSPPLSASPLRNPPSVHRWYRNPPNATFRDLEKGDCALH
jgi:hypothetical protein